MGRKLLSESDKKIFKNALEKKKSNHPDENWTLSDESEALTEASYYLLNEYLEEESKNYQMSWEDFEKWEDDKKITIKDKSVIRTYRNNHQEQCLRSSNSELLFVKNSQIIEWNEQGTIRAWGTSASTLRKCTGSIKSKGARNPKGLEIQVIKAFCYALDVNYDALSIAKSTRNNNQANSHQDKASKLEQVLVECFNYKDAIQKIANLAIEPKRVGIFQFEYQVEKSELNYQVEIPRVWLYKRIKSEMTKVYGSRYKIREMPIIDLADPLRDWNDSNFLYHIVGELGLNQTSLNEVLRQENILIVVKNVDRRSEEDLRAIVNTFRQHFIEKIEPMEQGGFCLMLWIDYGKTADWKKGRDFLLDSDICSLPIPDKFKKEDFRCVLQPLAQMFRQRELVDDPGELEQLWNNTEQGNPQKTLESFYRKFNCKFRSSEATWTKWT